MLDLLQAYGRQLGSNDPVIREAARRQLARLERSQQPPSRTRRRQSRWAHVPLDVLFGAQGNRLRTCPNGKVETGHEPLHSSRSGRCIVLDPSTGRWWCRSCRTSGDAPAFIASVLGCSYKQAVRWLIDRYGPPVVTGKGGPRQRLQRLALTARIPVRPTVSP